MFHEVSWEHTLDRAIGSFGGAKTLQRGSAVGQLKSFLVYFPGRITVADPFSLKVSMACNWYNYSLEIPEITLACIEQFRSGVFDLRGAFEFLVELRTLVRAGDIVLLPLPFWQGHSAVDQSIQEALNALRSQRLFEYPSPPWFEGHEQVMYRQGDRNAQAVTELVSAGFLDFTTIMTDQGIVDLLREIIPRGERQVVPGVHVRAGATFGSIRIPGLVGASMREIGRLRRSDDAFADFRLALNHIIERVTAEYPSSEAQRQADLRQAVDDIVKPAVKRLDSARHRSSVLDQILGGMLTLGGAEVTHLISGQPLTGVAVGLAASQAAWLLSPLLRHISKDGRSARILRTFYGYLLSSDQDST